MNKRQKKKQKTINTKILMKILKGIDVFMGQSDDELSDIFQVPSQFILEPKQTTMVSYDIKIEKGDTNHEHN